MSFIRTKLEKTFGTKVSTNLVIGAFFASLYLIVTVLIPYFTFTWLKALQIEDAEIDITTSQYNKIIYWIIALGSITTATAFCTHSSPPESIRKGILSLIQILLNCSYIWSYKYSGALDLNIELVDFGIIALNLTQLIIAFVGIYIFTLFIKGYNLIYYIVRRDDIRFKRGK